MKNLSDRRLPSFEEFSMNEEEGDDVPIRDTKDLYHYINDTFFKKNVSLGKKYKIEESNIKPALVLKKLDTESNIPYVTFWLVRGGVGIRNITLNVSCINSDNKKLFENVSNVILMDFLYAIQSKNMIKNPETDTITQFLKDEYTIDTSETPLDAKYRK